MSSDGARGCSGWALKAVAFTLQGGGTDLSACAGEVMREDGAEGVEGGVMQPRAKERQRPPVAGEQEIGSPWSLWREHSPASTLISAKQYRCWTLGFQSCERTCFCRFQAVCSAGMC